jgi:ribokinase
VNQINQLKTMPPTNPIQPVCIVGNLNIDLIIRNVPGMPPWGQEVMGTSHRQFSSGQAGYLAFALRRLGIPTSLIGNVGDDSSGIQILNDLNTFGVDTRGVTVMPGQSTGISIAVVRSDGERAFISDLGCLKDFTEELVLQSWPITSPARIVCLVGLFCVPGLTFPAAARLLEKSRSAGQVTMLDTGWDPDNWREATLAGMRKLLPQVSLFMPNWQEAQAITAQPTPAQAARALQALGVETVVIKCGEQGSYACSDQAEAWVPARSVEVLDTVGAGDVFNAGFLYGLGQGWSLEQCLAFGNTTASLYISRQENRFPHFNEVLTTSREYPALTDIN